MASPARLALVALITFTLMPKWWIAEIMGKPGSSQERGNVSLRLIRSLEERG